MEVHVMLYHAMLHGTPVDVFESARERRGADGIDARA
jgi:hypothetical protein